ncbi:hypothetical protein GCM10010172_55170 [Paractinoplanes ferrugineus]|uniref:Uncharacterized protein n=1 Tax=Paractinoplanes ferrugineus TaxID=113564 RepID=A0A919MKB2_9ACTN|nr:hypothetical protein [Actinoplanes ferrugineus]GIE11012.1 hypothetical protein Afe05nite_28520 [Actinoplanes ferrugineus]
MIESLFRTVSGRASQRVFGAALLALVFLGAAVAAWSSHDDGQLVGRSMRWLTGRTGFVQGLATAAVLVGVAVAGLLVLAAGPATSRLLEGDWPGWLDPLRERLVDRVKVAAERDAARAQRDVAAGRPDRTRRQLPSTPERYRPTRLGNLARAARTRPIDKYGLDPVAIWPHLFLVMPETTQKELTAATNAVERAVMAVLWSLLLILLTPWVWWLGPVGLAGAVLLTRTVVLGTAQTHAELLEASIDLHRLELYRKLCWPLPANPAAERELGEQLVSYLRYGSDSPEPAFTTGDKP